MSIIGPTPPPDGGQNARLSTESSTSYFVSTFIGLMAIVLAVTAWIYPTGTADETAISEPVTATSIAP
jgi:hypothetical protein